MAQRKKSEFKLPRYLRLARGAMWFDTDGDASSGVRLFAIKHEFVGRGKIEDENEIPKDKWGNKNPHDYGYIDKDLPWYIDTKEIPNGKLSRIILAFNQGVLVAADPKNPPIKKEFARRGNFKVDEKGDLIFRGRNKDVFKRLQNSSFGQLRDFVNNCPVNEKSRIDLVDMLDYERQGFNSLSRPRLEIIDLIRGRLNEFGPGISPIRIEEDNE